MERAPRKAISRGHRQREAGVDDVQDDDHVAAGHLEVEVLDDADPRASVAVGGQGQEVELAGHGQLADEVGEKADAALQEGDEHDALRVVPADLAAETAGDGRQLAVVEQGPRTAVPAGSPPGQLAKRRL